MRMTEVGAERDDTPSNCSTIVAALLQRSDREGLAQIVDARVST